MTRSRKLSDSATEPRVATGLIQEALADLPPSPAPHPPTASAVRVKPGCPLSTIQSAGYYFNREWTPVNVNDPRLAEWRRCELLEISEA